MLAPALCAALLALTGGAAGAPVASVSFDLKLATLEVITRGVARDVRAGLVAAGVADGDVAWVDPLFRIDDYSERAVLVSAAVRVRTYAAYRAIECATNDDVGFPMPASEGQGRFLLTFSYRPLEDAAGALAHAAVDWYVWQVDAVLRWHAAATRRPPLLHK